MASENRLGDRRFLKRRGEKSWPPNRPLWKIPKDLQREKIPRKIKIKDLTPGRSGKNR